MFRYIFVSCKLEHDTWDYIFLLLSGFELATSVRLLARRRWREIRDCSHGIVIVFGLPFLIRFGQFLTLFAIKCISFPIVHSLVPNVPYSLSPLLAFTTPFTICITKAHCNRSIKVFSLRCVVLLRRCDCDRRPREKHVGPKRNGASPFHTLC